MGAIADYNFGDLKKIAWNRATRTDKRVHALQNVFSCKVQIDKADEEESFRARLNALLPKDVKVFCVIRSSNRFNAKNCTSNREYSYYLPSFMLTKITDLYFGHPPVAKKAAGESEAGEEVKEEVKRPRGIKIMHTEDDGETKYYENQDAYFSMNIDHLTSQHFETLYKYRLAQDDKERVHRLFQKFQGSKKYHNFSKEVRPHQAQAVRNMLVLKANSYMYINRETQEVTTAEDPKAMEFIHFFLKGQAFLYNQIRKMIGSIIQIFRGGLDDDFLTNTFTDNYVNVCLAPGDGLLLE